LTDRKQVALVEEETSEEISDALVDIIEGIGQWERYLEFFPTSAIIQQIITRLYAQVVNFLVRSRTYYQTPRTGTFLRAD
jgi:hypothetical protein